MMNTTQAQAIAEKAVKTVDAGSDFEYVGRSTVVIGGPGLQPPIICSDFENTVVVGRDKFGYYVADNGDETNGLNRQSAVALIVKCLEAA